jgi:hypothetical protein
VEPNQLPTYRDLSGALPRPGQKPGWAGIPDRLIVSLIRLAAMIAVWGSLLYARKMVLAVSPAVSTDTRLEQFESGDWLHGRWEDCDGSGVGIEFARFGKVTIDQKGGGIEYHGIYWRGERDWSRNGRCEIVLSELRGPPGKPPVVDPTGEELSVILWANVTHDTISIIPMSLTSPHVHLGSVVIPPTHGGALILRRTQ